MTMTARGSTTTCSRPSSSNKIFTQTSPSRLPVTQSPPVRVLVLAKVPEGRRRNASKALPVSSSGMLTVTRTLVCAWGVPAALAIVRGSFPGRRAVEIFLLSPLSLPTIILAVGLLFFSAKIGLTQSAIGLVAGHVVVTVPYILRSIVAVYARANHETEEAAAVLGAPAHRVLWHVTLPIIRPGLIAGAMFAFLISFDEVAVALLMTTSDTTTLPVSILSYLVYNYDPSVAAISTIQIALVVGILLLLEKLVGLKSVMFTAR